MRERIQVTSGDKTYSVNLNWQWIRWGRVIGKEGFFKRFKFEVQKEHRDEISDAFKEVSKLLRKPHLAVTPARLSRSLGNIEAYLVPPVEVVGPKILLNNEP